MNTRDVEIIDTHVHLESWFMTAPDARPDPGWFEDLYSECRHRARLLVASTGRHPMMLVNNVASVKTVAAVTQAFPDKFIGSMMINPHDTEDALAAIELGVRELGMRAVGELVQYIHDWRTDGPEILPVIQKAIELDLPMMFHVSDETHAEGIARLAQKFPRGRFIAAHSAGGRSWRRGIRCVCERPNVWVEIMRGNEEQLKYLLETMGAERITYGTDFAIDDNPELRYRAGNWLLDTLEGLRLADADIERICSLNAKELLKLED
jgi:predicted TIM-barrel fold metal-dependent hydrolase